MESSPIPEESEATATPKSLIGMLSGVRAIMNIPLAERAHMIMIRRGYDIL